MYLKLRTLLLPFFVMAFSFFTNQTFAQTATVSTDQLDYAPGSTVIISGSGFTGGETVTLQILHVGETGDNATSGSHAPWDVVADADGNISGTWLVPFDEDELDATLLLTADGQTSGLHAEANFTDGTIAASTSTPCVGSSNVTITITTNNLSISSAKPLVFKKDGNTITTLTSAPAGNQYIYTINTVALADGGVYSYNATLNSGQPESKSVTLTVSPAAQGGSTSAVQTICTGSTPGDITLTNSVGTITWQKSTDNTFPGNKTSTVGTNSTTLTGAQIGTLTATTYIRASVQSGSCTAFSNTVTITVSTPPAISNQGQPSSASISFGQNATFSVTATNATTYKWQVSTNSGTDWNDVTTSLFSGYSNFNTATLTISKPPISMSGYQYQCIVGNTGVCTLPSNAATLTIGKGATLLTFLQSPYAVEQGSPVTVSAKLTLSDGTTVISGESVTFTISDGNAATPDPTPGTVTENNGVYTVTFSPVNYAPSTFTNKGNLSTYLGAIKANFSGDNNFNASPTGTADLEVDKQKVRVTEGSVSGSGIYGDNGSLTATVSPAVAGATVRFELNGNFVAIGTTNSSGVATASTPLVQYDALGNQVTDNKGNVLYVDAGSIATGVDAYVSALSTTLQTNYGIDGTPIFGNLTVNQRAITITINPSNNQSKIYGNADPATFPYAATSDDGLTTALAAGEVFKGTLTTRASGDNVGSYTISTTGLEPIVKNNTTTPAYTSNYTITYVNTNKFVINQRPITITADPNSKVYGNNDPALTAQVTLGSIIGPDQPTGSLTRAGGENVGAYAINQGTYTYGSNYSETYVSKDLTISKRPLVINVTSGQNKIYGNADPTPFDYTLGLDGFSNQTSLASAAVTDVFSGSLTRDVGEDVNTYDILQTGLKIYRNGTTTDESSNYNITYTGTTFTITKRPLVINVTPGQAKVYGQADPAFAYTLGNSTSLASVAVVDVFNGALTRDLGNDVGNGYNILQTGFTIVRQGGSTDESSNYDVTYHGATFSITKRPITITVTTGQNKVYGCADPSSFAYAATPTTHLPSPEVGLAYTDAFSGALSRDAGENVGNSYNVLQNTLTIKNGGTDVSSNYDVTYTGTTFAITKRPLVITVTPGQAKVYGQAEPTSFAYTLGLDASKQTSLANVAVTDAFSGALTRVAGETVNTYNILQAGLKIYRSGTTTDESGNYTIIYNGTTFQITKRPITVTVDAGQTKVYGQNDPTFTYSYTPTTHLPSTEAGLAFSDVFSGALSRVAGESVAGSPYTINRGTLTIKNGTGNTAIDVCSNYNFTFVNANKFTITPAAACVTYNGDLFKNTSTTSTSVPVTLSVVIAKNPSGTSGDITTAVIDKFTVVLNGVTTNYTNITQTYNPSYPDQVTYSTTFTANLGTSLSYTYDVSWHLTGNYAATASCSDDGTEVTVSSPTADFLTGGGYIKLTNSYGTYAGDVGSKQNFGFSVKWNKSYTNIQGGGINAIIHKGAVDYQIKSTKVLALTVVPATSTSPATATFSSNAVINTLDANGNLISTLGNCTAIVDITDVCEPGAGMKASSDQIAVTVKDKNGVVVYSSNWNATKRTTVKQALDGGNLQIHSGSTTGAPTCTSSVTFTNQAVQMNTVQEVTDAKFGLTAFPNPAQAQFSIHLSSSNTTDRITLNVLDAHGRSVQVLTNLYAGQTIQIGNAYRPGIYFVEMMQGNNHKQVKLLKAVY